MHTTVFTYTHTYTDFSISYCTNHEIMKPQPQHGVRSTAPNEKSAARAASRASLHEPRPKSYCL